VVAALNAGHYDLLPVTPHVGTTLFTYDPSDARLAAVMNQKAPVFGVSRDEALLYLAWLERKLAREGHRFRTDLPTQFEWEKAARGGDDRSYPWGNAFDPRFTNSLFSRAQKDLASFDPVMSFLDDESPAGRVSIWRAACRSGPRTARPAAPARGWPWSKARSYGRRDPADFRISSRYIYPRTLKNPEIGLRVVLRPKR
jgi:formylglycine-generating enzyme required for sulfatase activity